MAKINLFETALSNIASKTVTSAAKSVTTSSTSFLSAFKQVARNSNLSTVNQVSARAPEIETPLRRDVRLRVPNLIQGHNECGPTSLAMILQSMGIPSNQSTMFPSSTVGHGPNALKDIATHKGLTVRQENNGSIDDLVKMIDAGIPPMVLGIYGGGAGTSSIQDYIEHFEVNASSAHWMVVTGYKTNDAGQVTHIYFNDPNNSNPQCWTVADFNNKFWNDNITPGGHKYYMAMAQPGTFQERMLKTYLPQDKISSTFKDTLKVIDDLETAFYQLEAAGYSTRNALRESARRVGHAFEDAWDTVADAADDAWDEVRSWFS